MFRDHEALKSTAIVTVTWWVILTIWAAIQDYRTLALIPYGFPSVVSMGAGIIIGVTASVFLAWIARRESESIVAPDAERGLQSRLGVIPQHAFAPPRATALPQIKSGPIRSWREWLIKRSQPHAALFDAVLLTLAKDPALPATHVPGGHGGNSLLDHSLLVVERTLVHAPMWQYSGLRGKSGALILALRDPHYVFDGTDPLCGIVALAHDLGKIECYLRDKEGNLIGTRHAHDLASSRMLARMPEFWRLPEADRGALLGATGFYHHPQALPLAPDGRAADDRTIALMELLIHADSDAGRIEAGGQGVSMSTPGAHQAQPSRVATSPAPAVANPDAGGVATPLSTSYGDDAIWEAFTAVIADTTRINSRNARRNIGTKKGGRLYLRESRIREELLKQIGETTSPRLGDGRFEISVALMKACEAHNILYNRHDDKEYSYHRALFRVSFLDPSTKECRTTWPAAIILNVGGVFPEIAGLPDHPSEPVIERPVWSENSARNKAQQGVAETDVPASPDVVPTGAEVPPAAEINGFEEEEAAAGDDAMADMMAPVLDTLATKESVKAEIREERVREAAMAKLKPSERSAIERFETTNQDAVLDALMAPPKKQIRTDKKSAAPSVVPADTPPASEADDSSAATAPERTPPSSMSTTAQLAAVASINAAAANGRIECVGEKHGAKWYRLSEAQSVARKLDWQAAKAAGIIQTREIDGEVYIGIAC